MNNPHEQEHHVIRACQAGDHAAWNELIARNRGHVHRLCYRFTGRDCEAQDLTQEVFLRVFRKIAHFQPGEDSFSSWLTVVARNLLISDYRRKRREAAITIPEQPRDVQANPSDRPDIAYSRSEMRARLHRALHRISPRLRETVALCDIHELPYHEIAARQGVPIGTVKSRIRRGRSAMARLIMQPATE